MARQTTRLMPRIFLQSQQELDSCLLIYFVIVFQARLKGKMFLSSLREETSKSIPFQIPLALWCLEAWCQVNGSLAVVSTGYACK